MYTYDDYDRAIVAERVVQFRDQIERRLNGELSEEEFLPLRLQNGVYLQKHAYMLRIAIPYGTLSSKQLAMLGHIADKYDHGYGHFTTRQNIQFNWITLEQVPDILTLLAEVDMHAIQTSGNCVRNITTEAFSGVADDEIMDPRPLAEILRQWSTINPEFLFLPRKFKIALSASTQDRAVVRTHDIGLYVYRNDQGEILINVMVGGGLGRTPILSQQIHPALPWQHILSYVEAILRVYNRYGRRDNKYKARIKILVKSLGIDNFSEEVNNEWQHLKNGASTLTDEEYQRISTMFSPPDYQPIKADDTQVSDPAFSRWTSSNVKNHKVDGYSSIVISTKPGISSAPGDLTSEQMAVIANIASIYGFGEIRVSHEQNIILPDIRNLDLYEVWEKLSNSGLATANNGLLTDIITCPGGDYCSLANAKSIPVAHAIQQRFSDIETVHTIGELDLNISGCMNACAHHHIANIGILGVDKKGSEWYQVTIGGEQGEASKLGKVIGPAFSANEMPDVVENLLSTYQRYKEVDEKFIHTVHRIGLAPFKEHLYPKAITK